MTQKELSSRKRVYFLLKTSFSSSIPTGLTDEQIDEAFRLAKERKEKEQQEKQEKEKSATEKTTESTSKAADPVDEGD